MSSNTEKLKKRKTASVSRRFKTEKVVVDFDAEKLKAPIILRVGALLIDYILLIAAPVIALLVSRSFGDDGSKLLNSEISNAGWLIMVLIGLTNFIVFPIFSGQSIGKMLTGLKIVQKDGTAVSFGAVLLRNTVGYLLIAVTLGLGFLFALFSANGRALHDLLSGTVVVYGQQKIAKEVTE